MYSRTLTAALLLCAGASALDRELRGQYLSDHEVHTLFAEWKDGFGKRYASQEHEERALRNFRREVRSVIDTNNDPKRTWKAGLNQFSDLSFEEFRRLHLGGGAQNCSATHGTPTDLLAVSAAPRLHIVPGAIDWRTFGAVSPVKDQGQCGSCWTFSSTGAMESHTFLATGEMPLLSEQQLVDCAQAFDNHGCNGGLPSHAFEYVRFNGGIESEDSYPYTAENGACSFDAGAAAAKVVGQFNVTFQDEDQLVRAIGLFGPVSIAYQVASDFKRYSSGVYQSDVCGSGPEDVNHAVLAVGYGTTTDGTPYYIVKNSWGTTFGEDGFFRIIRGENACGLADCASFPLMAADA